MAHSKSNILLKDFSGMIGKQFVVRNHNGQTILSERPSKSRKPPTGKALENRNRFRFAAMFAKELLQDPVCLAFYKKKAGKSLSPYQAILKDYLKLPCINSIDASGYHGNPGEKIHIETEDLFELGLVHVMIFTADDKVVEQGFCKIGHFSDLYEYTATVQVTDTTGLTISVIANKLPDYMAQLCITL